jgi:NADH-quinone oxidoreductase subunit L
MYTLWIVLLPLLAAVITGLGCRYIRPCTAHRITIGAVACSFVLSCGVLKALVWDNQPDWNDNIYTWGSSEGVSFEIGFMIDRLSALMMVVVNFVSLMVHIYTVGYMKEDPGYQRFFAYISLFTFGMLMLVMANNFLQLFFGWETVGLMSYLLIGFWFKRESATFAGLKAFLVNRVGDLGFILGIAAILYYFGSLDYATVFNQVSEHKALHAYAMTYICMALFVGAMGKSAQVPLHVWLPDSMEGPTPISALIHAATMVTAGVFMVARMSPLFEHSNVSLNFMLIIGSITCLFMGILGIVQNDIKRIIAYSTLSQLGYMVMALGASAYSIAIFHLMTHAFFKALLFLGAGSVIIALHHEQNIWKMGALKNKMPITYITMLVGSLALIGFPFFSGFYSKDLIIEAVQASRLPASKVAYWIALGSVFVTALYTFRLLFVVFFGSKETQEPVKESPTVIWLPLVLLAIPSVIAGAVFVEPLLNGFFGKAIVVHAAHSAISEIENTFQGVSEMAWHGLGAPPFCLALLGILVAWLCYIKVPSIPGFLKTKLWPVNYILRYKYGFDIFNDWVLTKGTRGIGWVCSQFGDKLLIDGMAVNGTAHTVSKLSDLFRQLQTGYIYHYAFAMITGFLALLLWLLLN